MEIHHKIKPLHGWREFAGEVGIIVLGVLIAIGAEKIAERVHWHHQVEVGREALGQDMSVIFVNSHEREMFSRCLSQRLSELAAILDTASETGRLPPLGDIGNPPRRPWGIPTWTSLSAAQTASHFPRGQFNEIASTANYAQIIDRLGEQEFHDWTVLHTMVGPGRRVSDAEMAQLRAALSGAHYEAKLMRLAAYQVKENIKSTGLKLDEELASTWPERKRRMYGLVRSRPICNPIGKPPAHSGSAPLRYSLDGPVDS